MNQLTRPHPWLLAVILILFSSFPAQAQTLMELLNKGPVVLVETNKKGKFHSATAVMHIRASVEETWKIATAFATYKEFMPNLIQSDTKKTGDNLYEVTFEVEVPGMNPEYTFEYTLKPEKHQVAAKWKSGDLKGSFVKWKIRAMKNGDSLIYYTTASRNFSGIAEALEDKQQTVTIGVNVAAALAAVKAIKIQAEGE